MLRLAALAAGLALAVGAAAQEQGGDASIWERRVEADARRPIFTLTDYRPSYVLLTHAGSIRQPIPGQRPFQHNEIKLQLSLQTKVLDDGLGNNGDLWVSYSQVSYWQAFNHAASEPFRETNHRPEAYFSFLTNSRALGWTARSLNVGFVHESNGQAQPTSRSWNRIFAEAFLLRGELLVTVRPWIRVGESADNPDIQNYLGHYEIRAYYAREKQLYSGLVRNVFNNNGRYNVELDWSFPIAGRLRGLVQWYDGYGESLIDYNRKMHRLGIGLLISDWL